MSQTEELFLLAGIWTLVAVFIARLISGWPGRIAFLVVAVGLPFWELPYGFYNFQRLCNAEARLLVFDKFPPQDSICIEDLDSGLYWGLTNAGFKRIEVTGRSDDIGRDTSSGRVVRIARPDIKSGYCLVSKANQPLPWRMNRHDVLITRVGDDRIVARQSRFSWAGMWWQEQLRPVLGSGGSCFEDPKRPGLALRSGTN